MKYLISLIITLTFSLNCFAETTYTKQTNFCPISMSYAQLADLVVKLRTTVEDSNKTSFSEYASERMTIESNSIKVDLKNNFTRDELLDAPSNAISIRYNIDEMSELPISGVSLYLTDGLRQIEVSGTSRKHVDTVVAVVSDHINEIGCSYGGSLQRIFGGMVLVLLAIFLSTIARLIGVPSRFLPYTMLGSLIILLLTYLPSWDRVLPGTLITVTAENFFSRNSAGFTVAGLVIGIIGIGLSVYFGLKPNGAARSEQD